MQKKPFTLNFFPQEKELSRERKRKFMFCRFFPMPMSFAQPNYFSHILSLCYLYSFLKALAKCLVRNYRRILKIWFYGKLSSKTKIFNGIPYRSDSSFEMVFHSTLNLVYTSQLHLFLVTFSIL
jgi:hypothetical protein